VNFFTSIKFSKLLLVVNIGNEDKIEIPEIDEEIKRIHKSLSKITELKIPADELIKNILAEISIISDFNKSFSDLLSNKRAASWKNDVQKILYPDPIHNGREDVSFLLFNIILYQILKSINQGETKENVFDKLFIWKPFFEISSFLKYKDIGQYYELSKTIFLTKKLPIERKVKSSEKSDSRKNEDNILDFLNNLFNVEEFKNFVQVHDYLGKKYFNKERVEDFFRWNFIFTAINHSYNSKKTEKGKKTKFNSGLKKLFETYSKINELIIKSEYKLEDLLSVSKPVVLLKKTIKKDKKIKKVVSIKKKKL